MNVLVGGRLLLGSYWLQMGPGEQTIIALEPANARIILQLAEFDREGEPATTIELLNDTDLAMTFRHIKRAKGWGTTEPMELGIVSDVRILGSFLVTPFFDSVQIHATFYAEWVQEETNQDGQAAREKDMESTGGT